LGDAYTGYDLDAETAAVDVSPGAERFAEAEQQALARQLPPQTVAERVPVPDDSDSLTRATIAKMCQYIREGADDPLVQRQAHYACQIMGRIGGPPFGVFMFLKHKIRRVLDEGTGLRISEPDAADILISPAVLLRMANPQGDCDDFTMAAAALLAAAGLEQCIVTVACDPRDAQRWSHVFGMVKHPNGEWLPLDCSHGQFPGWMVPQHRISRWQAWDLSGNPIDVPMPVRSRLHAYVGYPKRRGARPFVRQARRGMGQVCTDDMGNIVDCGSAAAAGLTEEELGGLLSQPSPTAPVSVTPSTSTGFNWASLFTPGGVASQAIAGATKVATVAELPAGTSLLPSGAVVSNFGSAVGSFLPILLLAGGAILFLSVVNKK
jgi:hypothetical protein